MTLQMPVSVGQCRIMIFGCLVKTGLTTSKHTHSRPLPCLLLPPCSQDELGSPALAFVRLLVRLLSLDAALEEQVRLLRRSLLRLVGVDEFSPAANWVDPCITFRLPDVICR